MLWVAQATRQRLYSKLRFSKPHNSKVAVVFAFNMAIETFWEITHTMNMKVSYKLQTMWIWGVPDDYHIININYSTVLWCKESSGDHWGNLDDQLYSYFSLVLQTFRILVLAWCIHHIYLFTYPYVWLILFVTWGYVCMCTHIYWLPLQYWVSSCFFLSQLSVISNMFLTFIFRLWKKMIGIFWSIFKIWTSML